MDRIVTVCTGNICRSPMAEYLLREQARQQGLEGVVVESRGVSDEEEGKPMDPRAAAILRREGMDPSAHRARPVQPGDLREADLVLALDLPHLRALRRMAPDQEARERIRLLRAFDPAAADLAEDQQGIYDPWYGGEEDFETTYGMISEAVPGVLDWIRGRRDGADRAPEES